MMKIRSNLLAVFLSSVILSACTNPENESFSFMAIGDLPYNLPEDFGRFDRMIGQINEENPNFTIHVGDIKSGSVPCTNEYYGKIKNYFSKFENALIYTPGDNEWTDCHRPSCGNYEPEERLDKLRQLFFSSNKSQGKRPIELFRQNNLEGFEKFPENSMWQNAGVTFGTMHVIGSNNNFKTGEGALNDEFYEREMANNFWVSYLFDTAKKNESNGLVLVLHAGLNYNNKDETNGHASFVTILRQNVLDYGKPVLLLYGDHHRFMMDKPLKDAAGGTLTNFTAVQVFGSNDMHAVKVNISTSNPNLFLIDPFYIDGN